MQSQARFASPHPQIFLQSFAACAGSRHPHSRSVARANEPGDVVNRIQVLVLEKKYQGPLQLCLQYNKLLDNLLLSIDVFLGLNF